MSNKAHLTALRRKSLSLPCKYLLDKNLVQGRALDYGCGHGFDADSLGADKYDPHYFPTHPEGKYNLIYCNYVLNVIEDTEIRYRVIADIYNLLERGGVAFISVRNDRKKLNGITKRGTWQGYVELDLPVENKRSEYVMYRLTR